MSDKLSLCITLIFTFGLVSSSANLSNSTNFNDFTDSRQFRKNISVSKWKNNITYFHEPKKSQDLNIKRNKKIIENVKSKKDEEFEKWEAKMREITQEKIKKWNEFKDKKVVHEQVEKGNVKNSKNVAYDTKHLVEFPPDQTTNFSRVDLLSKEVETGKLSERGKKLVEGKKMPVGNVKKKKKKKKKLRNKNKKKKEAISKVLNNLSSGKATSKMTMTSATEENAAEISERFLKASEASDNLKSTENRKCLTTHPRLPQSTSKISDEIDPSMKFVLYSPIFVLWPKIWTTVDHPVPVVYQWSRSFDTPNHKVSNGNGYEALPSFFSHKIN